MYGVNGRSRRRPARLGSVNRSALGAEQWQYVLDSNGNVVGLQTGAGLQHFDCGVPDRTAINFHQGTVTMAMDVLTSERDALKGEQNTIRASTPLYGEMSGNWYTDFARSAPADVKARYDLITARIADIGDNLSGRIRALQDVAAAAPPPVVGCQPLPSGYTVYGYSGTPTVDTLVGSVATTVVPTETLPPVFAPPPVNAPPPIIYQPPPPPLTTGITSVTLGPDEAITDEGLVRIIPMHDDDVDEYNTPQNGAASPPSTGPVTTPPRFPTTPTVTVSPEPTANGGGVGAGTLALLALGAWLLFGRKRS